MASGEWMDGWKGRRKARLAVELFGLSCVSFAILSLVKLPFWVLARLSCSVWAMKLAVLMVVSDNVSVSLS